MVRRIKVLNSPNFNQDIILGDISYNLLLQFNTSDMSWYLSVRDSQKNPLISNIKVMPNQNLTTRYSYLNILQGGDIWCIRMKNDFSPIGRENIGIDKVYELVWISSEETVREGKENVIQL